MIDRLIEYFLGEPRRLMSLGCGLVSAGGLILVVGAIGHLSTTTAGIILSLGKKQAVERSLADVYPSLPTWWVPETVVGCLPAVLLIIVGVIVAQLSHRVLRQYF